MLRNMSDYKNTLIRKAQIQRSPTLFLPLYIIFFYISFTLSVAIWGPIDYSSFSVARTTLYICAILFSISLGYYIGIKVRIPSAKNPSRFNNDFIRRLFDACLGFALVSLLMSIGLSASTGELNTNPEEIGRAYVTGYEDYERNTGNYSFSFLLYSFSLPASFVATVLGIYYYKSFNFCRRLLVLTLVFGGLFYYVVGTGKQKQLGDIFIYCFSILIIKYGRGDRLFRKNKWVIWSIVLSAFSVFGFITLLAQRYAALGMSMANINLKTSDRISIDPTHPIFSIFGSDYGFGLALFSGYLSQGYYGLSLALETDWEWTRFQGFSYSISVLASRFLGLEWQWPNNLISQIEADTGWGMSKWHTVFTHFATDFGFPGTILLFGYFSFIYARMWKEATRYSNPISILAFTLLTVGVFFIPANNQLLHTPGSLLTVLFIFILHFLYSRRFNVQQQSIDRIRDGISQK